jgi:hypothetical protein
MVRVNQLLGRECETLDRRKVAVDVVGGERGQSEAQPVGSRCHRMRRRGTTPRIGRVRSGGAHDRGDGRRQIDRGREHGDAVEGLAGRHCARRAHAATGWLDADDAVERRGDALSVPSAKST